MQILNLQAGEAFSMGKGKNWKVIHPDMGAERITLNHGLHAAGMEFTQHIHGETEDMIVVLEGGVSLRQGDVYTPIVAGEAVFVPSGEVHGTLNTTPETARLISFQSPPDIALYTGERDQAAAKTPRPQTGHRSGVQILKMAKGGPIFGKPGDWRHVVGSAQGTTHLGLEHITLRSGEGFEESGNVSEEVYVVLSGEARVESGGDAWDLKTHDVIYLKTKDAFSLKQMGVDPLVIIRCYTIL